MVSRRTDLTHSFAHRYPSDHHLGQDRRHKHRRPAPQALPQLCQPGSSLHAPPGAPCNGEVEAQSSPPARRRRFGPRPRMVATPATNVSRHPPTSCRGGGSDPADNACQPGSPRNTAGSGAAMTLRGRPQLVESIHRAAMPSSRAARAGSKPMGHRQMQSAGNRVIVIGSWPLVRHQEGAKARNCARFPRAPHEYGGNRRLPCSRCPAGWLKRNPPSVSSDQQAPIALVDRSYGD